MTLAELLPPVRQALTAAGVFRKEARLICAVSGGADSVALLYALCALQPEGGYDLRALHVQHGLRGESSLADERFVRALCRKLHVPLIVENANLTGGMADAGAETRARDSRRRIFAEQMEAWQAHALLLAHHRDDQTETVLMHLLRGAGMAGLCGMRPCVPFGRGVIVRPLLNVPKQALVRALEAQGLAYCVDESNFTALTPRNALRLAVLPEMEELFPAAGMHIAQTAQALSVDEAYLTELARDLYRAVQVEDAPLFALWRDKLLAAPEALVRRVLRYWVMAGLAKQGELPSERALSHADTLSLLQTLRTGKACNLPCGLRACAGDRLMHLVRQTGEPLCPAPPLAPVPLTAGEREYRVRGLRIVQQAAEQDSAPPTDACSVLLTSQVLAMKPVFRLPMAGDRLRPLGATGSKPLRRFLTDRKVDPLLRPLLPVLAAGNEILWIPSLCTAHALRVTRALGACVRLRLAGGETYLPHQPKE